MSRLDDWATIAATAQRQVGKTTALAEAVKQINKNISDFRTEYNMDIPASSSAVLVCFDQRSADMAAKKFSIPTISIKNVKAIRGMNTIIPIFDVEAISYLSENQQPFKKKDMTFISEVRNLTDVAQEKQALVLSEVKKHIKNQALQGYNKLKYSVLDFHGLILSALKSEQNLHIFSKLFNQTFSSLQKEGFGISSEFDSFGLKIHISW